MLKLIITCALVCACAAASRAQAGGVERLRDVTSVYVPEWGQTEKAKALRQEVVRKLGESGRVRVVASREEADAVLDLSVGTVSKNVDSQQAGFFDPTLKVTSTVTTVEVMVFQLREGAGRALWSEKIDPTNFRSKDEAQTARVAGGRLGRDLLKAIEKDRKNHGRRRGGSVTLPGDLARA